MKNNISVYFDNRVILFVHTADEEHDGNSELLKKMPEWNEAISFLTGKKDRLIYESVRPEMSFRHFMTFFTPVEAAGGLVKNSSGKWLFILRKGRWDLPKGLIEKNERSEHAAVREVQEECGITTLKIIQNLPVTYHIYPDKNEKWMLKKTNWYLMNTYYESTLTPQSAEEITKVEWRDPAYIDDILQSTYGNIRDLVNFCKTEGLHK